MNWTTRHTFNPDMEAIKPRYEYQLIEEDDSYILILNEEEHLAFPKDRYTQLKAEIEANDVVEQAREKHGNSVYYAGIFNNILKTS